MPLPAPRHDANAAARPTRGQSIVFAFATVLSAALAAAIAAGFDRPWQQAALLPLLVSGALLVAWNTPWALCFIAFSIMPFCVVQQEVLGITLNLPEILILALAAKEGLHFILRREHFPPALPLAPLAVLVTALVAALATGLLRRNGATAALQDFRQFSEFVVLFWLVVQCVRSREQAWAIALCFVLGSALIASHGILQQFTFAGISEKQIASDFVLHQGVRSGSFYGATALGGMMVLACGPAIGVLLASRRRTVQALVVFCIMLCLFALVFTKTRGSWLGLMVVIGFMGVSVRPSKRIIASAAALALLFALLTGPLIVQRIATLADPANDQSLMDRAQYYAAAYHIGRAHPVLGLGWGCYYDITAILQNGGYLRVPRPDAATLALLAKEEGAVEATVHSAYLQLFVKSGALGVLGFFAVVLIWLERAWRARNAKRDSDPGWALYAGVTAGLAGYLFHSTFENFFQWPVMAQSFWLLMGLSFALAPCGERPACYRVPAAALGAAVSIFAVFMYACIKLEALHTDNYQQNVAAALERGNIEGALVLARRAAKAEPTELMRKAVYGRVLLQSGQAEAALDQLGQAAGIVLRKGAPPSQNTGVPCYFAPARLSLGRYHFEQGDWVRAAENFELARAYDDLSSEVYAEFHPVLYATYAKRGRWARALVFGKPGEAELAGMPGSSLVQLGRALEGREEWEMLQVVAQALSSRGEFPAEAAFFAGRASLAQSRPADALARLAQAAASGDARAAYLHAAALEGAGRTAEALQAYAAAPQHRVFRPMALARAVALATDTTVQQSLVAQLNDALAALVPLQGVSAPEGARFTPIACARDNADDAEGGRFPLLLLWEDHEAAAGQAAGVTMSVLDPARATAVLQGSNRVLQLQWVENRVNWESVERAYPGDQALPGWIDAGRDWFNLRRVPGFTVTRDEAGDSILVLSECSWMFSVPLRVAPGSRYLVLGRTRDPGSNAHFGWQLLDAESVVLDRMQRPGALAAEGWTERVDYVVPGPDADALRLVFETVTPIHAPASLDDAAVLEIAEPVMAAP